MANYRITIEDGLSRLIAFQHITDIISQGLIIKDGGVKTYRSKEYPSMEIISTSTEIDAEIVYVFTVLKPLEKQYKRA